jgi:hypothetical protein
VLALQPRHRSASDFMSPPLTAGAHIARFLPQSKKCADGPKGAFFVSCITEQATDAQFGASRVPDR